MDTDLSRETVDAEGRLTLGKVALVAARIVLAAAVIGMIGIMLIYYWTEPANLVRINRPWSPMR